MKEVWEERKDGWVYISRDTSPEYESGILWEDRYVRLYIEVGHPTSHYRLYVDKRRVVDLLSDYSWVLLSFGRGEVRRKLVGKTLWSDRNVALVRYGVKPRSYILVAKREKDD